MKKNRNGSFSYSGKLSKVLLRMKLTFVLLLCVTGVRFSECTNNQFEKTKCFFGRNSLGIERKDTAGVHVQ